MVKMGDVEKTKTIRNKYLVRVFINHDSLVKHAAYYQSVVDKTQYELMLKNTGPQVFFGIAKDKFFEARDKCCL